MMHMDSIETDFKCQPGFHRINSSNNNNNENNNYYNNSHQSVFFLFDNGKKEISGLNKPSKHFISSRILLRLLAAPKSALHVIGRIGWEKVTQGQYKG